MPNLVETVKGYAAHERGTLDEVTQARAAAVSAGSLEQKAQAENVLTSALGKLMAVAEAYPDLKANQNFLQLQASWPTSRTRSPPRAASSTMRSASTTPPIQRFPAVLIAGMFGFTPRDSSTSGRSRGRCRPPRQVKFKGSEVPCAPRTPAPTVSHYILEQHPLGAAVDRAFPILLLGMVFFLCG